MEQVIDIHFNEGPSIEPICDFNLILIKHGLEYEEIDYYLQVGEITWTQGWIINISVIATQLESLLDNIIPFLIKEQVPFKIPLNLELAKTILNGQLGYEHLGKVVSIYPSTDQQAVLLANHLIKLTESYKGPRILTDRHLGNVVYVSYGGCNPIIRINDQGVREKYIYDTSGNLIKDYYTIPFVPPSGIYWPFSHIKPIEQPKKETVLKDKYKPMAILKEDAKGDVKKALWLKHLFNIKWCVLKEGKLWMFADEHGRDIRDRLRWQYEVHNDLYGIVPVPRIYDFFEEGDDSYLVMEYIKGNQLDNIILKIFQGKLWCQLSLANRLRILNYSLQILDIIERMHLKGYIHRDITPGNFLVRKNEVLLIDLELTYSIKLQKPNPPFRLGTFWFMSDDQLEFKQPTEKDDIYSIGATLIVLLTGLLPSKFDTKHIGNLQKQLYYFIIDKKLVRAVSECFNEISESRPTISYLREVLQDFMQKQIIGNEPLPIKADNTSLNNGINYSIKGLATSVMMTSEHLWFSKTIQESNLTYYQNESGAIYGGFHTGVSGILFVLARANKLGFEIAPCLKGYSKCWEFITRKYLQKIPYTPSSLYAGLSGIAIAMIEGIECGLLPKSENSIYEIQTYLNHEKLEGLSIATGIAGQGMALLRASSILDDKFINPLIKNYINRLLELQQKDGSWLTAINDQNDKTKTTGFGHGVAGIICFLIECYSYFKEPFISDAIKNALQWLINQGRRKKNKIAWYVNNKTKNSEIGLNNGCTGVALAFIKAYYIFKEPLYKKVAENSLRCHSRFLISRDYSLANGTVGIGEVYLEAAKIFTSEEWEERAHWIANSILNSTQQQADGSLYWLVDSTPFTTADLMNGNSGIIHFLMRCLRPNQISHPLLLI